MDCHLRIFGIYFHSCCLEIVNHTALIKLCFHIYLLWHLFARHELALYRFAQGAQGAGATRRHKMSRSVGLVQQIRSVSDTGITQLVYVSNNMQYVSAQAYLYWPFHAGSCIQCQNGRPVDSVFIWRTHRCKSDSADSRHRPSNILVRRANAACNRPHGSNAALWLTACNVDIHRRYMTC